MRANLVTRTDEDTRGLVPLSPASLPELIAERIIDAVARRQLLPLQHLIETELSEHLSVSRIPLREALRVLQTQGIVVAMPRRGVRLIAFDAVWARELYDARVALERLASHAAAARLRSSSAARAELSASLRALEAAADSEDPFEVDSADLAFHSTVYELSNCALLQTMWAALARHVRILFSSPEYRAHDPRRVVAQHRLLRDVLLRGSASDIDREVARHVAGPAAPRQLAAIKPSERAVIPARATRMTIVSHR